MVRKLWGFCQQECSTHECTCPSRLKGPEGFGNEITELLNLFDTAPKRYVESKTRSSTSQGVLLLLEPIKLDILNAMLMNVDKLLNDTKNSVIKLNGNELKKNHEEEEKENQNNNKINDVTDSCDILVDDFKKRFYEQLDIKAQEVENLKTSLHKKKKFCDLEVQKSDGLGLDEIFDFDFGCYLEQDFNRISLIEYGWNSVKEIIEK